MKFLVVECKRVKDTSWIFLVEGLEPGLRRHAKCFVFEKSGEEIKNFHWKDSVVDPWTVESQFCVIPGSDSRSPSLIERVSAELVSSTEGLASEEKRLSLGDRYYLYLYFNVIVTTATLLVCRFDPHLISIETGVMDDAIFEEVPNVRFRKQLNPIYEKPDIYAVKKKQERIRDKKNTIFVVNSMYFFVFLRVFEEDKRKKTKESRQRQTSRLW